MLTLKVNDGTNDHFLDLYENDPVNLKFQYSDITEIQKAAGTYSQTFRIPATQPNVDFFGTFFNANLTGGFNPKRKKDAELSYNTIPIASGFIQLKAVYIQKENYADFEVVFFGENVSLARTLGDKKLKDLDLSAFDHIVNYSNVNSSWSGGLFSGKVRYGIIDKGRNWDNTGIGNPINSNNAIYPAEFTPFLRVREIVNAIFADNGFTLDSSFFSDAAFDNYYTPLFNGFNTIAELQGLENETFQAGLQTTLTTWTATFESPIYGDVLVPSVSDTTPFYDNGSNFASNAFTPPADGYYTFQLQTSVDIPLLPGYNGSFFARNLIVDGSNNIVWASPIYSVPNDGDPHTFNHFVTLALDSSMSYKKAISLGRSTDITISPPSGTDVLANGVDFGGTWWKCTEIQPFLFGQTIDTAFNAPDIKQIDYLTSLQKMFNLVFIPDKNDPIKITIEPFNDYAGAGLPKDWTPYIDYDKDVVISPTTDLQFKNYEWTYSEDKDYLNVFYKENANRIYGRYLIEDGENDFATGDYKVQPLFSAYPLTNIGGTEVLIHKSIGANGQVITDPKCKVVYWGGLQTNDELWAYNDATNANVNLASYPYFGHYSLPNPDVQDIDLNFGGEIPAHPIDANPYDNLYNTYWRQYVDQLYSSDSRLMDAHFYLTAADIADFQWNDSIWIKDSYWRVIEMNYSPNSNDLVKCRLIKILADIRPCEWLPHTSGVNGVITFIDSNGNTGTPTEECCTLYGYEFINGTCYRSGSKRPPKVKPTDNLLITSATTGDIAQGTGFNQGVDNVIHAKSVDHIVSGYNISIPNGGAVVTAIGSNIEVTERNYIQATGAWTNAFVEGAHRGGGFYYDADEILGYGQNGVIPFLYEGDFDQGDVVELFIEGKQDNRLSIPDDTGMYIRADVCITTYNASTNSVAEQQTMVFYEAFKKVNGVAVDYHGTSKNLANVTLGDFGTATNKFHLDVDVTTNTAQHRILFENNSQTNTKNTRIVCWITYVMAQW